MFKTLKSKLIFLIISLLLFIGTGAILLAYTSYNQDKKIKIETCDMTVAYFSEISARTIDMIVDGAKDLAVIGSVLFSSRDYNNHDLIDLATKNTFANSPMAVGGGLWYEPYIISKDKKRFCSYAYNDGSRVILDKNFESEAYDYHNQIWYKFIKHEINDSVNNFSFTKPYIDEAGTHSLMITFGGEIYDKNGNFVGMSTVDWQLDKIIKGVQELKPTKNSFALFADRKNDFILALTEYTDKSNYLGKSLKDIPWYDENLKNASVFNYKNTKYITFSRNLPNNMILIVNVPENELFADIIQRFYLTILLIIAGVILLSIVTYFSLINNVNKPIDYLIKTAAKIGSGDLDEKMQINSPEEFAKLASSFNKMTADLQEHMISLNEAKAARQKLDEELEIARSIQASILPSVFPPYPDRKEFDIYASMTPAKEVGGDFYDFFFIDDNNLAFLIADVSGKGIPAALFMMTAKTMIKNLAKTKINLADMMTYANEQLCSNNTQGYFVTMFLYVINLQTGELSFVNAGHNPPLLKRSGGKFEYFKTASNFVLAALDSFKYKTSSIQLNSGDVIFLYTDGVTEAQNVNKEFYGEERLLKTLNAVDTNSIEGVLPAVKNNLLEFVGEETQYDDVTMLAFKYNGQQKPDTISKEFDATNETFADFIGWLEELTPNLTVKDRAKLNVAVEEIFINIVSYAYPDGNGKVFIDFQKGDNYLEITFRDNGIPYDPLKNQDPDVTLSAQERQLGGLGIFIVKKTMDYVYYKYENNQNVLSIKMYENAEEK